MNITTNNTVNRKELAQKLAAHLGVDPTFSGPPAFEYHMGEVTVTRDGSVIAPDETAEDVLAFLVELGAADPVIDTAEIEVPDADMDGYALRNLINALHSKQYLLNRVIGTESIHIPKELVDELTILDSAKASDVKNAAARFRDDISGLDFGEDSILFAVQTEDTDLIAALKVLFTLTAEAAKKAKRVSSEELRPENEKYYFRIWLVRLGLAGKEAKVTRRTLLDRLKGNSAFRTPEDAARFSADQKAKRQAKKAALAADEDADTEDTGETLSETP